MIIQLLKYLSANNVISKCFYSRLPNIFTAFAVSVLICFYYQSNSLIAISEDTADPASNFFVSVSGESVHSGIFTIAASKMTDDVIEMALVDSDSLKYEKTGVYDKYLNNGSEIKVASVKNGILQISVGMMPVKQRIVLQIPLNLSEISAEELLDVPGIGAELAKNIIFYRQNNGGKLSSIDLPNVAGIGISKYAKLKKYFN